MRGNARGASGPRYPGPRKRFGQHFLEPAWVAKLIAVAAPDRGDVYLEIGPGRGALTRALAPLVSRLVCVEIDRALAEALAAWAPPHVEVVQSDVLTIDMAAIAAPSEPGTSAGVSGGPDRLRQGCSGPPTRHANTEGPPVREHDLEGPPLPAHGDGRVPIRVIGNLPYNISTPILFKLLTSADEGLVIRDAVLMLQKEVADRLMATPGTKTYGTLAVQVARVADIERLLTLPPGAFRPAPKVTSAVVRLRFRPSHVDVGDPDVFARLVRGVFAHRRKTMLNALTPVADSFEQSAADLLRAADVVAERRPEDLTLADFARLSRRLGRPER